MEVETDHSAPMQTRSEADNTASAALVGSSTMSMEDLKDMDPAEMQLQMLFTVKQMAMMTRELERMQTKASPDNKMKRVK
jgi:hypothetical protein